MSYEGLTTMRNGTFPNCQSRKLRHWVMLSVDTKNKFNLNIVEDHRFPAGQRIRFEGPNRFLMTFLMQSGKDHPSLRRTPFSSHSAYQCECEGAPLAWLLQTNTLTWSWRSVARIGLLWLPKQALPNQRFGLASILRKVVTIDIISKPVRRLSMENNYIAMQCETRNTINVNK